MMIFRQQDIQDFILQLKPNQPIMGVDYGDKRIGIAKTDRERIFSNPLCVINNPGFKEIKELILKERICGFIVGYPLSMDGIEGDNCKKVQIYTNKLFEVTNLPIYLQDERLSTKAAKNFLNESYLSRKEKDFLDNKIAASIILESFLNFMRNS